MSTQKNKTVIAITLAIVSVLLLGGLSFTFFPTQTQPALTPQLPIPSNSITTSFVPTANSTFHPMVVSHVNSTSTYWVTPGSSPDHQFSVYSVKPLDSIVIEKDGTVNSTAPIKRNGNTYTLTGDIINQTIVVQRDNVVIDGANHVLAGFNKGNSYALENMHLENLTGVIIKNLNISLSWEGIWIQNCTNITIENNHLTSINNGIDVNSANSTTLARNTFDNLTQAIVYGSYGLAPSIDNTISHNVINNVMFGITMAYSYSNKVSDNIISNVNAVGIQIDNSSDISGNILMNEKPAIGITVNSYCTIYQNTIANFESGFQLFGINNQIYENTVENCSQVATMSGSTDSYSPSGNIAYHNNFLNNSQQLLLVNNASSSTNFWDNGKVGNYWSSYNGTDMNVDGIGDISFQLGDNNTDLYPLMQPYITQVNSYDHVTAQIFFTLAGIIAAGGVFIALTWAYFGKRTVKKKLRSLNH